MTKVALNTSNLCHLQQQLWSNIEHYEPLVGNACQPGAALRNVFFTTPRHLFVHDFRLIGEGCDHQLRNVSNPADLEKIYQNIPLMYVDSNGLIYEASNSEPAFIFHLLALLDIKPGDHVLEIGCGTGWLLAMMAKLTGHTGQAIGIEIVPELAERAQRNLSNLSITNAEVFCGDGCREALSQGPSIYEKIIVTASMGDISKEFYDVTLPGSVLVVPIRNKGTSEEVLVLERDAAGFRSRAIRVCKFVRMAGIERQVKNIGLASGDISQLINNVSERHIKTTEYSLCGPEGVGDMRTVLPLSSFLSKTNSKFRVFRAGKAAVTFDLKTTAFGEWNTFAMGLDDRSNGSLCIWYKNRLNSYGNDKAAEEFKRTVKRWKSLGCPTGAHFSVAVIPRHNCIVAGSGQCNVWREDRHESSFVWSLPDQDQNNSLFE
ncbi:protein-L-isoaspartate O-methyltransferase family protein [Brucella pituitosa]|uniref:protein-L-isoaspartate O-methyltransferase family protein n=1 Tax=Brucella pituitosa TaxID=571256 RepID=UPI0009A1E495|nr:methyltransferase domain-containing protein [Brucella pituitosa]